MWVVARLHDACERLGPFNHGEVIGSILHPFVSRDNYWMLTQHGLFQTYFYARHLGLDPNARDKFKSDPAYEADGRVLRQIRRNLVRPGLQERAVVDLRADGPAAAGEALDAAEVRDRTSTAKFVQ